MLYLLHYSYYNAYATLLQHLIDGEKEKRKLKSFKSSMYTAHKSSQ